MEPRPPATASQPGTARTQKMNPNRTPQASTARSRKMCTVPPGTRAESGDCLVYARYPPFWRGDRGNCIVVCCAQIRMIGARMSALGHCRCAGGWRRVADRPGASGERMLRRACGREALAITYRWERASSTWRMMPWAPLAAAMAPASSISASALSRRPCPSAM